jgi:hypothetical protein
MPISTKKPDDKVGEGRKLDDFKQRPEQKAVLGGGGEESGRPEPKDSWSKTGEPGRPPTAIGGNSQGQGDRMPAGGGTVANAPASNPKTQPGHEHES